MTSSAKRTAATGLRRRRGEAGHQLTLTPGRRDEDVGNAVWVVLLLAPVAIVLAAAVHIGAGRV